MAKVSKPILIVGVLGVIVYAAMLFTEPETEAVAPKRKARTSTQTKRVDLFTDEDRKAKFASLNLTPKNSFKPLVVRASGGTQATPPDPSIIPMELTGGEASWFYTGEVEVDGTKMALLENFSTGEGVYLKKGERWKQTVVSSIADETLLLVGPSGTPFRIRLGDRGSASNVSDPGIAPVSPLSGNIGVVPNTPGRFPGQPGFSQPGMMGQPGTSMTETIVQPGNDGREPRRRRRQ